VGVEPRAGLRALMPPSTGERIARASPCSVLVVPTTTRVNGVPLAAPPAVTRS
jgi:hypothetical protein